MDMHKLLEAHGWRKQTGNNLGGTYAHPKMEGHAIHTESGAWEHVVAGKHEDKHLMGGMSHRLPGYLAALHKGSSQHSETEQFGEGLNWKAKDDPHGTGRDYHEAYHEGKHNSGTYQAEQIKGRFKSYGYRLRHRNQDGVVTSLGRHTTLAEAKQAASQHASGASQHDEQEQETPPNNGNAPVICRSAGPLGAAIPLRPTTEQFNEYEVEDRGRNLAGHYGVTGRISGLTDHHVREHIKNLKPGTSKTIYHRGRVLGTVSRDHNGNISHTGSAGDFL